MIIITLDDKSAEDVKAIRELQKMGVTDEQIQEWYDNLTRSDTNDR